MKPAVSGKRKLGLHRKFLCPILLLAAFEAFKKRKRQRKEFLLAGVNLSAIQYLTQNYRWPPPRDPPPLWLPPWNPPPP